MTVTSTAENTNVPGPAVAWADDLAWPPPCGPVWWYAGWRQYAPGTANPYPLPDLPEDRP